MRRLAALPIVAACATAVAPPPTRVVHDRTLVSVEAPAVRVELAEGFRYVGGQRFILYDVADAEQHVFVDADAGGLIHRLCWLQFEGFLPGKGKAYTYDGETVMLGQLPFVSNTAVRSTTSEPRAGSDGARMRELLRAKGHRLPPDMLWQRLVHLTDESKRRELMMIYMEDVALHGAVADAQLTGRARGVVKLTSLLLEPDAPELNARAPDAFDARFETSEGTIVIEVHRDWAPRGADRFYNLVRAGYYDGVRLHRVVKDRWAQFGINGEPSVAKAWRGRTIPDDPRVQSNVRGTVAFAFAVKDGRTTQVFINLRDNSANHDKEPFAPFGRVTSGMDVADALYAEYGETSGGGIRAGRQDSVFEGGNAWLDREFPKLDRILRATIAR